MKLASTPTRVGRFRLGALIQADEDIHIYQAHDPDQGLAVRLALLNQTPYTPGGVLSPTRQQFTVDASQGHVVEAGTWNQYSYLALSSATPSEVVPVVPAAPPLSISLWVRLRPFAAAFALVLATLVGLHVWDGVGSTHDEASTPGGGSLMWGGAPGVSLSLLPTRAPRSAPTQPARVETAPTPAVAASPAAADTQPDTLVTVERIPVIEAEPLTIMVLDKAATETAPAAPTPRPTARPATIQRTQPGSAAPIYQAPRPAPAPVYRPPSNPAPAPRPAPAPTNPPAPAPAKPAAGSWAAPVKAPNAWKRD